MKVLFDSNILISAAVFGGAAMRAFKATTKARWKLFASEYILTETGQVIRDKLGGSPGFTRAAVHAFRQACEIADDPRMRHHVPRDPDDTPVLRAAIAAGVDYLVTRDADLLTLNPTEGVRIITLAEYLHILQDHGYALD